MTAVVAKADVAGNRELLRVVFGTKRGGVLISKMVRRHVWSLVFRTLLLVVALFLYFTERGKLHYANTMQQGFYGVFLWIVWLTLAIGMLRRIIPNKRVTIGARKHYACSFSAVPSAEYSSKDMHAMTGHLHKGALLSALAWFAVSAAALFVLFIVGVLTQAVVMLFVLVFAVLDLVFILFFCPFQALFLRKRCCIVCRIYNWDYFMMCAPLILFPSFYSVSLVLLSMVVLLRWEIALHRNPRFFMEETNENLRCEACNDKLCRLNRGTRKDTLTF